MTKKKEENVKRQKLDSSGETPIEPTPKPQTEPTIDVSFKKAKEKPAEIIESTPKAALIKSGEVESNSQEDSNLTATENTIFVGDIPDDAEESELDRAFAKFGVIQSITLKHGKNYGFIKYKSKEALDSAINAMNGEMFCGRRIRVSKAVKRKRSIEELDSHDRVPITYKDM